MRHNKLKITLAILTLLIIATIDLTARPIQSSKDTDDRSKGKSLFPQPVTVDRITHNRGNIALNIDNWGYVGGYQYGLPSGEYPRNSGHDYIAEILYWMGAVTASGDTVVANTFDDFQGMQMPHEGNDEYIIYLSTDQNRYYGYDENDTVGTGINRAANGWRVWDTQVDNYDYNTNYNSLSTSFIQSGPTSQQDSHYRFNDAASGQSALGLEITQTVYQWNYCYNEDFMFVQLDITNNSTENYTEFAVGVYVDIDVGGNDGQGGNGNTEDMVYYDTLKNYAYIYDVQNYDPGWDTATGIMGTVLLETPDSIGMTALRTDDWSYFPTSDEERFAMINSQQYDTPLPPTDQFYVQCIKGINLPSGSTVRIVYAIVAGDDADDFDGNAAMAQQLYDSYFIGPEPPKSPVLSYRPGDGEVFLSWTDFSEASIDPMSGDNDFAGYKLYRSDNKGRTWGKVNYNNDNSCLGTDYYPLATYRALNPGDPVPHSYIDNNVYNGVEYWYCLVAFDRGDTLAGVDVLQNGFANAGEMSHVVSVTPRSNPAGYYEASTTVVHNYTGTAFQSDGEVIPVIFDETKLTANEYKVVFEDTPYELLWYLLDNETGDTILANQNIYNNDIETAELAGGLQVLVTNAEYTPKSLGQTSFGSSGISIEIDHFNGPGLVYWTGVEAYAFAPSQYRATYELRYSTDFTMAVSMWEGFDAVSYPLTPVPFEVWNLNTNQRVSLAMDDWPVDGVWQPDEALMIVDFPYDPNGDLTGNAFPYYYGWHFNLDPASFSPVAGDVYTIEGNGANSPDDYFVFKTGGIDNTTAKNELKDIKVVPNPYLVRYSSLVETDEGSSKLYFNNLPDVCTIRIYNMSGDMIKTIEHNSLDGSESWNLLTNNNHLVSSGIYIYHVDSQYGEFIGRLAIVK